MSWWEVDDLARSVILDFPRFNVYLFSFFYNRLYKFFSSKQVSIMHYEKLLANLSITYQIYCIYKSIYQDNIFLIKKLKDEPAFSIWVAHIPRIQTNPVSSDSSDLNFEWNNNDIQFYFSMIIHRDYFQKQKLKNWIVCRHSI